MSAPMTPSRLADNVDDRPPAQAQTSTASESPTSAAPSISLYHSVAHTHECQTQRKMIDVFARRGLLQLSDGEGVEQGWSLLVQSSAASTGASTGVAAAAVDN
ncbi:hypothetical protein DFH06DRAFT_1317823 [Mycena polygramma]|nr:hypothetical protein DFH06DRAFT_1317823 [Mycena polygramma]